MRIGGSGYSETDGVWDPKAGRIVIKRDQLSSVERFGGTLLHEIAHAVRGTPDVSADFEDALTTESGRVISAAIDV